MLKTSSTTADARDILLSLGVEPDRLQGGTLDVVSPIDGTILASVHETGVADVQASIGVAHAAYLAWRQVPATRRGELGGPVAKEPKLHFSCRHR